nr:hypothetical protein [Nocardia flavorosea]
MAVGGGDVAEGEFAEIDAVGEYPQNGVAGPGAADAVAVPACVQHAGDGGGAEAVVCVELEYQANDRGFVGVGDEGVCGFVGGVAEGSPAAFPEPFRGFAFHSGDDAVDDGVAFELCEGAEHLYQHPAHGGRGVEWFGCRAEYHIVLFEIVEQGHHVAQVAGESVHPVDQKDVDLPVAGCAEGFMEVFAVGGGPGGIVGEASHDVPAGLGSHVGFEARGLCVDGVGLVVVVGGAARVDGDSYCFEFFQSCVKSALDIILLFCTGHRQWLLCLTLSLESAAGNAKLFTRCTVCE